MISIDAQTWNQGLYFIRVTTQDNRRFEHKIIKL
ncbi:MAG: T9SS type A sorting domain-containing protein [Flavobacteriales bacterium]